MTVLVLNLKEHFDASDITYLDKFMSLELAYNDQKQGKQIQYHKSDEEGLRKDNNPYKWQNM